MISSKTQGLGDTPNQMDTESSFNQCYDIRWFYPGSVSIRGLGRHVSICFHKRTARTGSQLQLPTIVKPFAFLWDRKQANRKCVKQHVPTPTQARGLLLFKVLHKVPKNTGQIQDSLSIIICLVNKYQRLHKIKFPISVRGESWTTEESKAWCLWALRKSCGWTLLDNYFISSNFSSLANNLL